MNCLNRLYELKEHVCFISNKNNYFLSKGEVVKLCKSECLSKNNVTSLIKHIKFSEKDMSNILLYHYKFLYQKEVLSICLSPNEFKKAFSLI